MHCKFCLINMFQVFLLVLVSLGLTQADKVKDDETIITKLDLSNKGLTSLDDYDFAKYPQLEEVDLSNNLIENIQEGKFTKNKNLKKLNLSGNTHLKLPEFSTLLIADIEELNLSNCTIEVFPPSILDGLIQLKVIDLSNNPLKSVKLITFNNLLSPEKIILPNLNDKDRITEICNELNITIENSTQSLHCSDIRNGKWDGTKKDNIDVPAPQSDTSKTEKDAPVINTNEEGGYDEQNLSDVSDENEDDIITDSTEEKNKNETDDTAPETDNKRTPKSVQDIGLDVTDGKQTGNSTIIEDKEVNNTATDDKQIPESEQPPETDENQLLANQDNPEKANNTIETQKLNNTGDENANLPEEKSIISTNNLMNTLEAASTDEKPKPDDAPAIGIQSNLIPDTPAIDIQRVLIDQEAPNIQRNVTAPPQIPLEADRETPIKEGSVQIVTTINQGSPKVPETKQAQQVKQDDTSEVATGASTSGNTGTNVLIFLVIAVVISGVAAFGYRFYKTRTYRPTNTHEPIERELQEIVTEKRSNGPMLSNVVEEEPLMEKNENSVEIKAVDETNHTGNNTKVSTIPTENAKYNEN